MANVIKNASASSIVSILFGICKKYKMAFVPIPSKFIAKKAHINRFMGLLNSRGLFCFFMAKMVLCRYFRYTLAL